MDHSTAKERILKNIRDGLIHSTPEPFPVIEGGEIYQPLTDEPAVHFAEEFKKVNGNFFYCENREDFRTALATLAKEKNWETISCQDETLADLCGPAVPLSMEKMPAESDAGLTFCEALIARTGTILMTSQQPSGRALSVYPPVHLCVAYTDQLVNDIADGMQLLRERYTTDFPSMINLITGPSRTADIEKTLVLGAHGPREVYVFLLER